MVRPDVKHLFYTDLGLSEAKRQLFVNTVNGFPEILSVWGLRDCMHVHPLRSSCAARIHSAAARATMPSNSEGKPTDVTSAWVACWSELQIDEAKLVIGCDETHPRAQSCRSRTPAAQWGSAAVGGIVASWYSICEEHRSTAWHEILHLLGAGDCYDEKTKEPTCGLNGCLMRWDTTIETLAPGHYVSCKGSTSQAAFQQDGLNHQAFPEIIVRASCGSR